jgi:hypothetical protein
MTKDEVNLEALKMAKDWSTWLILIQTGVCAFLWNVLKNPELTSYQSFFLHCGWFAFSISVVIATILVSRLPSLIEEYTKEEPPEGSVIQSRLKHLFIAEHTCFLLGILSVIIFITLRDVIKK